MTETLAHGYSYESTQQELSDGYQHDRVSMVFISLCILVLGTKVSSALERLICSAIHKKHASIYGDNIKAICHIVGESGSLL